MASVKWQNHEGVIVVTFGDSEIVDESAIQQIGTKWLEALEAAAETKKLVIDFQGVRLVSSAMIGKMVLLNKKAKENSVELTFRNLPPDFEQFIRRLRGGDDGGAGAGARLTRPPSSDGGHAVPDRSDED